MIQIFLKKNGWNYLQTVDPDQMPLSSVSDLGLHCLSVTLLGVSSLQWANIQFNP